MVQDLAYSLRLLRRAPGFSAAAIVILALAIGANSAVFSLVDTLILQPRPGRVDELFGVFSRDSGSRCWARCALRWLACMA
jgi:putative ABC transport system permease protein